MEFNHDGILDGPAIRYLSSDSGAAAARNEGWRQAKNQAIVFLDDDVSVDEDFIGAVRRLRGTASQQLIALRVRSIESNPIGVLVSKTVALDRGPETRRSEGRLALHDVWRYGNGAAMLVDRQLLSSTGGFKTHFGAGRRNGGAEDIEFIWHASHHGEVAYSPSVAVYHEDAKTIGALSKKVREYGRAIAHLGAASPPNGRHCVVGYLRHLERNTRICGNLGISKTDAIWLRLSVGMAVLESLWVYLPAKYSNKPAKVLCNHCAHRG